MAFCENCIHYDICQLDYNLIPEHLTFFPHNEDCKQFKNKADFVGVKHGEWQEERWCDNFQHICSLCHKTVRVHPQSVAYKYCPYCGAKMDGERSEE